MPMGKFGQDAEVTPLPPLPGTILTDILGFLMTTESQNLGTTSHPKDGAFYSIVSPSLGVYTWSYITLHSHSLLQKLVVFYSKLLLSVSTAKHQRAVARILNVFVGKHPHGSEL